jgi:hydroxymethylbilane synthase
MMRAGTRGSKLAWTQSGQALETLGRRLGGGMSFDRVRIDTRGDRDQRTPLATLPGTGLFTKELEAALLRGEIHLAIHSLKDVPFELAPGTELHLLEREDPRDCLLSPHGTLARLPEGALVGTGSPRRIAQLKNRRPDLRFADLRGNLDTRLRRLESGEYDAIVLAAAGLERLGWASHITERLDPEICLPAFGQGVLALQCRSDRRDIAPFLAQASDPAATLCANLERQLMRALGGGCKRALAALAETGCWGVRVRGVMGDPRTGRLVKASWRGGVQEAGAAMDGLAAELLEAARIAGLDADA